MTFLEAYAAIAVMFPGKKREITHAVQVHSNGDVTEACTVHIYDFAIIAGKSFEWVVGELAEAKRLTEESTP